MLKTSPFRVILFLKRTPDLSSCKGSFKKYVRSEGEREYPKGVQGVGGSSVNARTLM